MSILDLDALCHDLLDACVAALDEIPSADSSLVGAPDRSFVSPGLAADDCCDDGQLTVYWDPIQPDIVRVGLAAGTYAKTGGMKNIVQLTVRLVRCAPMPEATAPDPTEQEALAAQKNADAWAIWNHVYNEVFAKRLFVACHQVYFDNLRNLRASGGCTGLTYTVRVELDGDPDI